MFSEYNCFAPVIYISKTEKSYKVKTKQGIEFFPFSCSLCLTGKKLTVVVAPEWLFEKKKISCYRIAEQFESLTEAFFEMLDSGKAGKVKVEKMEF